MLNIRFKNGSNRSLAGAVTPGKSGDAAIQLTLADRITVQGMEILLQFTQVQYPKRGIDGRSDMGEFAGITGEAAYWI